MLEVFRKHIRPTDATGMDNRILECLETYGNIVESLDGWRDGLFLPPHVARQVLLWCDQFCHQYISLAQLADTMNLALFCVKPKLHWFWHLCHRCQYLHPRAGNCFLDENFVGKVKRVVISSSLGKPLHMVPNMVMSKWIAGKQMMLKLQQS